MMADFLSNLNHRLDLELKSATFLPFAATSGSSPYSRLNASNSSLSCIPTLPDGESQRTWATSEASALEPPVSSKRNPDRDPLPSSRRSDDAARLAASLARRTCLGVSSPTLLPKTRDGA